MAMLVSMAAIPVRAYGAYILYRFTGTVEVTDETLINFPSPVPISDEIQAQVGDRITGTFGFPSPYPFPADYEHPFQDQKGYGRYDDTSTDPVLTMSLVINGHELTSTWSVDASVLNDRVLNSQEISLRFGASAQYAIGDYPLANFGDACILGMGNFYRIEEDDHLDKDDEILMDGALLPEPLAGLADTDGRFRVYLNFTDSTGSVFQDASFPESIDFSAFDIAKGFLHAGQSNGGIMFNIDSFEEVDRSAPTLTTGFHVSWPSDAEGYVLEVAGLPEGPWMRSEGAPIVVEGQNIVVMDMESRSKFYRLTEAD